MPHLRIDYTGNLDPLIRMQTLCASLAATLAGLVQANGQPVFPLAGTRVLAYPAPCHAVADGHPERAFIYLNLRVTPGRSAEVIEAAGAALVAAVGAHIQSCTLTVPVAATLHIDQIAPSYEGRCRPA